jgi:hypothetical protein
MSDTPAPRAISLKVVADPFDEVDVEV